MSIINDLLELNLNDLTMPKKDFNMKLKKLQDREFVFPLEAIRPDVMAEIKEGSMRMTGTKKGVDMDFVIYDTQLRTIIEGCPSVFKNENIISKFNAKNPKELIGKLLLSGEIDKLNDEIEKLSGYDDEDEKSHKQKAKN